MLFTQDLEQIVFNRHQHFATDELIIISGYVGPKPVEQLGNLPFNAKVIYGMYGSEGIKQSLHDRLIALQNSTNNVSIFYSKMPVHSKCYIWRKNGDVVHALIGSANFSSNGLRTPFREMLAETTSDSFNQLNIYIDKVINFSHSCLELDLNINPTIVGKIDNIECKLSLLGRNGQVQNAAGLNWGQNPNNHTKPDDAYIKIRVEDIKNYPELFPPKQIIIDKKDNTRGRNQRHNDSIEIIWDDGISMEGLLEGSQEIDEKVYPKQISSFPVKSELGYYMRKRLGLPSGVAVRQFHLQEYGRDTVTVSKIGEGVYKFDFSV